MITDEELHAMRLRDEFAMQAGSSIALAVDSKTVFKDRRTLLDEVDRLRDEAASLEHVLAILKEKQKP